MKGSFDFLLLDCCNFPAVSKQTVSVEVSFVERRIESSDHARPMANPIESQKVARNHFVSRFNGKLHVRVVLVGGASELWVRTFFGAMKSKFLCAGSG